MQIKETRLIAWYKWEFLRRNPEYRKDYGQFMEDFGSWFREHGYWYNQKVRWKPAELRFFLGAIAPQAKIICERWQIREPLPPLCKFKESDHVITTGIRKFSCQPIVPKRKPGWDGICRNTPGPILRSACQSQLPLGTARTRIISWNCNST